MIYRFEFELTDRESDMLFYALGLAAGLLKNRDFPEQAKEVEKVFQKALAGSTPHYCNQPNQKPK